MSDILQALAKKGLHLRNKMNTLDASISIAQGVRSTLSDAGGGSSDIADRYLSLIEDYDRCVEAFGEWDDLRQEVMECIEMVDEGKRAVLYAAMEDVLEHGSLVKARAARRAGKSKQTFTREYEAALSELDEVMEEHGVSL